MAHFLLQENSDGTVKLTQKQTVYAEVCGKVISVNTKNRTLFNIHAEKMDRKFRCCLVYKDSFCPLREGDAIFGVAEYMEKTSYGPTLNIVQPPFVVLGQDKNTIIKNMSDALRGSGFGAMKANQLIDELIIKTGNLNNAINTLDRMASHFNYLRQDDTSLIQPYLNILKEKQMLRLLQWWYKNRNLRRLWLLGINNTEIKNSYMSPEKMYQVCLENPYMIFSLNMEKCDSIMNRIGKPVDKTIHTCAIIARKIKEYMGRGWSGIPTGILLQMYPEAKTHIETLRNTFDIKTELHTAYLPFAHEVETGLCDLAVNLIDGPKLPHAMCPSEITYTRGDISPGQKKAVEMALSENICIIRGGAGTGKTTVIKEIIHNLDDKGIKYRVVSFTGKAVARIREVTDRKEPMTMHMSITTGVDKKNLFAHLIVDEASMVTSELLYNFKQKFDHDFRITLIGDPNQLTPIGWGVMFDQLIKSQLVPTCKLTYCHRVDAQDNGILLNANSIIECNEEDYHGPPFDFIDTETFNIVDGDITIIKDLIEILLDNGVQSNKITVISPYNRDLVEINKMCQQVYNGVNRSVKSDSGQVWRLNDRVMLTENNYAINLMNGEEGIITDLTHSQVQVTFKDGSSHVFYMGTDEEINQNDLNAISETNSNNKTLTTSSLIHSFGVSVHRYQGSECDNIIFYIPKSSPSKFLNRNLLYTGITRGKKNVYMVGDYDTMIRAATTAPAYRCDNLAERLKSSRTITV